MNYWTGSSRPRHNHGGDNRCLSQTHRSLPAPAPRLRPARCDPQRQRPALRQSQRAHLVPRDEVEATVDYILGVVIEELGGLSPMSRSCCTELPGNKGNA